MGRTLSEIELGIAGLKYFQDTLKGERGLCRALRELPIESGSVIAPLPEGTTLQRALQFDSGVLCFLLGNSNPGSLSI
jgi:hypothetical protein